MLKRLYAAFAALFVLTVSAQAAGTVPGFSLTPQFDLSGKIAPGCKLYTIVAGTVSTPQNAFQDSGLTLLQPNPMTCDAAGRLPQWFVADGNIKLRLTDKNGVQIFSQDGLLVVGASSGGGGGSPVDPTTILQTGQIIPMYGTGIVSGFVRANGRTIGNATSGATERANADTSSLFSFLWNADPNLAVSGGRGASAGADFSANKTISLPDFRNMAIAGLGDMGNSDRALFAGATFTFGNSTLLGSILGVARRTLVTANLPPYTPAGTNGTVTVNSTRNDVNVGGFNTQSGGGGNTYGSTITLTSTGSGPTFTGTAQGGTSTPFDIVQPTILSTIYLKL